MLKGSVWENENIFYRNNLKKNTKIYLLKALNIINVKGNSEYMGCGDHSAGIKEEIV